jgi:hypothetical protein
MFEIAVCDDESAITGYLEAILKESGHLLGEGLHIQVFHRGAAYVNTEDTEGGGGKIGRRPE